MPSPDDSPAPNTGLPGPNTGLPIPTMSRAVLFHEAGRPLELVEFPIPGLEPGEALVRVECCTICGSDRHTVEGHRREATPTILGHEILGRVTRLGTPPLADVAGVPLQVGDRVTWSTCVSCGRCERCRRGMPQKCLTLAKYGHERATGRGALAGGLADFLVLRVGSQVVRVPEDLPAEVVTPANCATATVHAALWDDSLAERTVLILGAGLLGLTAAAVAATRGAAAVVVGDVDTARLDLAQRFGASATIGMPRDPTAALDAIRRGAGIDGFDRVLELSGAPAAVDVAVRAGALGAEVVLVGSVSPSPPVGVDPESIVRRLLTIRGVHNYLPDDLRQAVEFLRLHHCRFPFADLVAASYELPAVNAAFEFVRNEKPVRVAVRP